MPREPRKKARKVENAKEREFTYTQYLAEYAAKDAGEQDAVLEDPEEAAEELAKHTMALLTAALEEE